MIKTTDMLLKELKAYKDPANKIRRLVKAGEIFPVTRGLYTTRNNMPGHLLAGSIYGPSYLSFDFALAYHGLIPEAVYTFTSASFDKKRRKVYETLFGTFTYRDIPSQAYPAGVIIAKEGTTPFLIASPEKALCDKLYELSPATSQKELLYLLFEDLRIDENEFSALSKNEIKSYATLYNTTNHKLLIKLMEKMK